MTALVVAIALGASSSAVTAADDSRSAARELVGLFRAAGYYDDLFDMATKAGVPPITVAIEARLERQLTPAEREDIRASFGRAFLRTVPQAAWDDLYVDVVVRHVPLADLQELVRYYRSPAGVKALRLSRLLNTAGARAGEDLVKARQDQFVEHFFADLAASMPALKDELARVPRR